MKPLISTLAGAAVLLALAAGPVAAQGREHPPAGGGGAASGGGGGAGVRTGGGSAGGGAGSSGGGAVAVPRGSSSGGSGSTYTPPSSSGSSGSTRPSASGAGRRANPTNGGSSYVREMYGSPTDRAVPRGARPNPGGRIVGQAVVRPNDNTGQGPGQGPGHRPGGSHTWYYPYNPYFLYGYGAFGLGYLYYDPFWWGYGAPYDYGYGGYDGYGGYSGGYGYYGDEQVGRGGLKLKVEPKDAEVYVDGYYMGTVDDFDGTFQKMELEAGAHRVEIRAPGYQTISFDVRIEANDTVTYRGVLQGLSKR